MYYQNCTASLGSQTRAIKAQHILTRASIPCTVVATTVQDGKRGCGYGVEFPCSMLSQVKTILEQNTVAVREYSGGDRSL
ncbi:MAG: DUF3343 domain-containing protein [Clostridia bacterium]|nr:DUF3343 domain-containing protein [Clostridia bacterium]